MTEIMPSPQRIEMPDHSDVRRIARSLPETVEEQDRFAFASIADNVDSGRPGKALS
jgi:hypothetical protein